MTGSACAAGRTALGGGAGTMLDQVSADLRGNLAPDTSPPRTRGTP
ncbi:MULTISPECIES: hypothetical protein [unclassified Streptomyces]